MVQIPVSNEEIVVHDSDGREIQSQFLPVLDAYIGLRDSYFQAYIDKTPKETPKYWLAFTVSIPPFGFSTYTISNAKSAGANSTKSTLFQSIEESSIEVGHGNLKLTLSTEHIQSSRHISTRSSNDGACIFRPNHTFLLKPEGQASLTIMRGPLTDEVHKESIHGCISLWTFLWTFMQITRLYNGREHVDVEFIVGIGKEVAAQITTTIKTNKTLYTDSNGRDFVKRIRVNRPDWKLEVNQPVARNYYPINLGI